MQARTVLVPAALLIVLSGLVSAQPQPPRPSPIPPPSDLISPPRVPTVPQEKSVDDLLTELEQLRAQKAALEKKEQELTASLRKKLDAQAERLQKLGIAPKDAKPAEPDRVGHIVIEGNVKTPNQKILAQVDLRPGQILHYPKLEETRARLEMVGFKGVTVEVIPESDSTFKTVRVRIDESKR